MTNKKLKIGISVGDINGIGLEVILKTLADKRILNWCTPVLYGSTKVASYHKNIIKVKDLTLHNTNDIHSINPNAVNVINCWLENVKITLGKCTADGGKYATFSLEQATEDLKEGHLDALVTAPINKKAMQLSGFAYPGHTEYLTHKFNAKENLMLMINESLRIGLITNHLPLSQVASTITKELILQKIELMNQSLKMDFGIDKPAIALLGLNPHAGDDGVLGNEEIEIILPAIEAAKKKGILVIGPYAADGFFGSGNYSNFDGILAMYHDQGLVPFKALSFGNGVNFTAGLPIIRTSPDHGTGFEIAGKNNANPQSFREALYQAIDSAKQRADYLEMTGNPLKIVAENEIDASPDDIIDNDGVEPEDRKAPHKKRERKDRDQKPKKEFRKQSNKKQENKQLSVEERLALAAKKNKTQTPNKKQVQKTSNQESPNPTSKKTNAPAPKADKKARKEELPTAPIKEQEPVVLEDNIMETMEPIPNLIEENEIPAIEQQQPKEDTIKEENK
ncbi:4-hydroxythreonine-4-phosphate dehydrogenase PdxA [Aureispira anguillae]|uniref:4-hydroxythreonine-4-phosphate dehydrogenase PdxA n=1 Tax=Aureispira anguillae TaxID=2864201 RepID=A0A915YM37_9BACT|nr:4-hydroxythreonine-4-phosphate dehydrogenase PdxA [Aureispira anguillae]BDS15427.1 4-hydroxythreonine-4-phosphate dehydrogenase PdxA [Aureispira anguillae]